MWRRGGGGGCLLDGMENRGEGDPNVEVWHPWKRGMP